MKKIEIGVSFLTNTIYAGHLLKDGKTWAAGKQDVTMDVLCAVAQHGLNFGEPILLTADGLKTIKITVEVIKE